MGSVPGKQIDAHAETLVTMHMRALGFADAVPSGCATRGEMPATWDELLPKAVAYVNEPDGGVDVTSRDAVAQVKAKWRAPVPRADVSQLHGDTSVAPHTGKRRLFYAVSYAAGVEDFADEVGIALFTFDVQGCVKPVTDSAERLVAEAAGGRCAAAPKRKRRADPPAVADWKAWTKDQVAQWLESEGFEHYAPCLAMAEGVDLADLTADDLAALPPPAIPSFVARKMLAAFARLRAFAP